MDVARQRLRNTRLVGSTLTRPAEVVRWHGAMQAQEPLGAWWALGDRAPGLTEADVVAAFDAGEIVRTHLLRPTWHLVAAEDLRWLLRVTAPRVHVANRSRYAQLDLDVATRESAAAAIGDALAGHRHLTRPELRDVIVEAGIDLEGHTEPSQRLAYLLMHAELEGVICSGPHRGAQHTYARIDERLPADPPASAGDELAELAHRYLQARGPATAADLAWWSGQTIAAATDALARAGAPAVGQVDGRPCHAFPPVQVDTLADGPVAHLLQPYDELFIGLRDRREFHDPATLPAGVPRDVFDTTVVAVDGRAVGTWRRTRRGRTRVEVEVRLVHRLDLVQRAAVTVAAERYARFLERDLDLAIERP